MRGGGRMLSCSVYLPAAAADADDFAAFSASSSAARVNSFLHSESVGHAQLALQPFCAR